MKNIKKEKVIVVGPSGSGKDYLLRKLVEKGMKPALKWTTRPQRKFEKDGETYKFVNEYKFNEALDNKEFAFHQSFDVTPEVGDDEKWYYGITNEDFINSQVLIMTPGELFQIDYETRTGSKDFLINLKEDNINEQNIDFFYISQAYDTIYKWFENQSDKFDKGAFIVGWAS